MNHRFIVCCLALLFAFTPPEANAGLGDKFNQFVKTNAWRLYGLKIQLIDNKDKFLFKGQYLDKQRILRDIDIRELDKDIVHLKGMELDPTDKQILSKAMERRDYYIWKTKNYGKSTADLLLLEKETFYSYKYQNKKFEKLRAYIDSELNQLSKAVDGARTAEGFVQVQEGIKNFIKVQTAKNNVSLFAKGCGVYGKLFFRKIDKGFATPEGSYGECKTLKCGESVCAPVKNHRKPRTASPEIELDLQNIWGGSQCKSIYTSLGYNPVAFDLGGNVKWKQGREIKIRQIENYNKTFVVVVFDGNIKGTKITASLISYYLMAKNGMKHYPAGWAPYISGGGSSVLESVKFRNGGDNISFQFLGGKAVFEAKPPLKLALLFIVPKKDVKRLILYYQENCVKRTWRHQVDMSPYRSIRAKIFPDHGRGKNPLYQ
jgi:hypothetical protein